MDLYAYVSIGALEGVAKQNRISVPRRLLEKVDDHFDGTYCDIYARIQEHE